MATKPIERLLFAQGGLCFFCGQELAAADASVEHLVAKAHGGGNRADNTVVCCSSLNSLFGSMSLKEKLLVVLNQKGSFKCPNGSVAGEVRNKMPEGALERVVSDLRKRGKAKPKTLRTLTGSIHHLFRHELSSGQVTELVAALQSSGVILVSGTKVSYLPIAGPDTKGSSPATS